MSTKILLLEDDLLFSQSLEDFLDEEGFEVVCAYNPQDALDLTFSQKFDLYLLDINLPLMSGIEFLDALRQSGDETPSIFLTSYTDKDTMKEGFLKGCDDYLKKPVDLDELSLRINSLMRRYKGKNKQCLHNICIDLEQRRVFKDDKEVEISQKEFILISLFFKNVNKLVTKEMIIDALWDRDEESSEGAIRVYINRLKKILGTQTLKNVRGLGYIYE